MFSNTSTAVSHLYVTVASAAALVMVTASLTSLLPDEFKRNLNLTFRRLVSHFKSPHLTLIIPEFDGLIYNEVYEAAEIYLAGKINPTTRKLRLIKHKRENTLKLTMEKEEQVNDLFDGIQFNWRMECKQVEKTIAKSLHQTEVRSFELIFNLNHKDKLFASYLPHVLKEAKMIAAQKKTLKLFTMDVDGMYANLGNAWRSVNLEHPSSFDTLAMDPNLKKTILDDLNGFVQRKEFYKSVGRAWKRGYLLYGPPGTGKSSLIAAMANYLKFDIYDLDLTEIHHNSDLRKLMVATANRSILVVEDIDCNLNFHDRAEDSKNNKKQVTLSGLLNFIDGLWSTCGDERIIIFTTNHKDKLDPALLRPGRMDMHIHMSYCTPAAFKVLAYNYLKKEKHPLFKDIKRLIKKVKVTPAEVAEKLMKNDEPDVVIQELLDVLEAKEIQQDEVKATKVTECQEGKECLEKVDTSVEEGTWEEDNDTHR